MNAWNGEFVRAQFDKQALGFISTAQGQTHLNPPSVGREFRALVHNEGAFESSVETLHRAQ